MARHARRGSDQKHAGRTYRDGYAKREKTGAQDDEDHDLRSHSAVADRQTVTFGVRPEALTDVEGADQRSTHVEHVANTVTVTEPAGSDTLVATTTGGAECVGRTRSDADIAAERATVFAINLDKVAAFDRKTEAGIV